MEVIEIKYRFLVDEFTPPIEFNIRVDSETMVLINPENDVVPEWANLDFHQCEHCPLKIDDTPHCPVAVNLHYLVDRFKEMLSIEDIMLEVITEDRTVRQQTSAQDAISSIMGLLIATSGCEYTTFFKGMARHHLPLANTDETILRSTSMYLLGQYYLKRKGQAHEFGFEGLRKIYENMQTVNKFIIKRLRVAARGDSSVNALVLLDMYAQTLPMVIEDSLEDVDHFIRPYAQPIET